MPTGMLRSRRAKPNAAMVRPTLAALTPKDFAYRGSTGLTTPWPSMMIAVAMQSMSSDG